MVLWLEWSVPSGLVPGISLLSRVCGKHLGTQRDRRTAWAQGCLGGSCQSRAALCLSHRGAQGADVLGLTWLTKFSFLLPKIKWHGQEHMVEPATLSIPLELTLLLYSPQLRVFSPSPLCLPARLYDPSPTYALSQCSCWLLFTDVALNSANTTSLVPSIPVLTRHFFPCLLTKDFSCRAVCQVTHLFSWKSFSKNPGEISTWS